MTRRKEFSGVEIDVLFEKINIVSKKIYDGGFLVVVSLVALSAILYGLSDSVTNVDHILNSNLASVPVSVPIFKYTDCRRRRGRYSSTSRVY